MSSVSPDASSHRVWSGVINAVGSTVIQGDTTAGRDVINLTLNSFLPSAQAFYNLCQSSDDPFKDVARELKDLLSGFEQAEGFLNNGDLDQAQQDVLARHLSQSRKIVEGLQQLKSGLDVSNMLPTELVNRDLLQRLAELMNKLRPRVASINYFNTTISSQAYLGQLIRQTIEEHFPVEDKQSVHTFWTAQSQTSEEMESWRQLRKKLRDLCSGDPSQLKANQTRVLMILRQYYSGNVLTDAFLQDEIEAIEDSDEDDLTSRDASPCRDGSREPDNLKQVNCTTLAGYASPLASYKGQKLNKVTISQSAFKFWPKFLKVAMFEEGEYGPLWYVFVYDPRGKGKELLDLLDRELEGTHECMEISEYVYQEVRNYAEGLICICRVGPIVAILNQRPHLMRMYAILRNQLDSYLDLLERGLFSTIHDIGPRIRGSPSLVAAGFSLVDAIADLRYLPGKPGCWHGTHVVDERKGKEAKNVGLLYLGHAPSAATSARDCSTCRAFWGRVMVD